MTQKYYYGVMLLEGNKLLNNPSNFILKFLKLINTITKNIPLIYKNMAVF